MRRLAIACLTAGTLLAGGVARGEGKAVSDPRLERLYASLRPVFLEHFPQATSEAAGDRVHFEHDTRPFLIHMPLKTGEWQEAVEVRGPNRRGILCNVQLVDGVYGGAAMLPMTSDDRYFKTLVMAVASPSRDAYLYVHLSYPDGVSREFLGAFVRTLDGFWPVAQ